MLTYDFWAWNRDYVLDGWKARVAGIDVGENRDFPVDVNGRQVDAPDNEVLTFGADSWELDGNIKSLSLGEKVVRRNGGWPPGNEGACVITAADLR